MKQSSSRWLLRSGIGLAFILSLGACSTVVTQTVESSEAGPYSGTQRAYRNMTRSTRNFTLAGETWFHAADVPLSFVADTLILPYQVIFQGSQPSSED